MRESSSKRSQFAYAVANVSDGEVVGERPADPPLQVAVQRWILVTERLSETTAHTTSFPLIALRFRRKGRMSRQFPGRSPPAGA